MRTLIAAGGLIVSLHSLAQEPALYPVETTELNAEQREATIGHIHSVWATSGVRAKKGFLDTVKGVAAGMKKHVVAGESAGHLGSLVSGAKKLWKWKKDKGLDDFLAAGNPLQVANSVVSDVGGMAFCLDGARGYRLVRAHVFVQNFPAGWKKPGFLKTVLTPAKHIGIVMQDGSDIHFGGDFKQHPKIPYPIYSTRDETDAVSLERLHFIHHAALPQARGYSVWVYNCAGFVDDVLDIAEMETTHNANLSIGRAEGVSRERKLEIRAAADRHVKALVNLLISIEKGEALAATTLVKISRKVSPLMYLHLVAAAARSGDAGTRQLILEHWSTSQVHFEAFVRQSWGLTFVRAEWRQDLRAVFDQMSHEGYLWMAHRAKSVARIYAALSVTEAPGSSVSKAFHEKNPGLVADWLRRADDRGRQVRVSYR